MLADDIIAAARSCLGTPFQHQGRLKGIALDCAGMVVCVANEIGADYFDQQGYSRTPSGNLLAEALSAQPCLDSLANPAERLPGDLLLFRFGIEPQHIAILGYDDLVIHSYEHVGICCEHLLDDKWARRIARVYRFKVPS